MTNTRVDSALTIIKNNFPRRKVNVLPKGSRTVLHLEGTGVMVCISSSVVAVEFGQLTRAHQRKRPTGPKSLTALAFNLEQALIWDTLYKKRMSAHKQEMKKHIRKLKELPIFKAQNLDYKINMHEYSNKSPSVSVHFADFPDLEVFSIHYAHYNFRVFLTNLGQWSVYHEVMQPKYLYGVGIDTHKSRHFKDILEYLKSDAPLLEADTEESQKLIRYTDRHGSFPSTQLAFVNLENVQRVAAYMLRATQYIREVMTVNFNVVPSLSEAHPAVTEADLRAAFAPLEQTQGRVVLFEYLPHMVWYPK